MDFYRLSVRPYKNSNKKFEVYPEFKICRSKDLMIRGNSFYVVYDESTGMWSDDRYIIAEEIDKALDNEIEKLNLKEAKKEADERKQYVVRYMRDFSSNHWIKFDQYVRSLPDNAKVLDDHVTFADPEGQQKFSREDYVSKTLPYPLKEGPCEAWDTVLNILYDPEEREKIEWAIGAILSGEAKKIQKFLVFYGPQGSGKSTILNIVMKLLEGYYATFKAESLVNSNDQFGCKFLSTNPLVAIDEDTNLSRIETNATINKIASHEELEVNEKYKSQYVVKPICMMMLGTNKPVRITDAKSGIIRRLIDIEPSGRKIRPIKTYESLIYRVKQELGQIAYHCMEVYNDPSRGAHYYDDYVPERMMYRTDAFFNFMEEYQDYFNDPNGVSASRLWEKWKAYCDSSGIEFTRKRYEIIDEAKNYFREFQKNPTGKTGLQERSVFKGLILEKFDHNKKSKLAEKIDEAVDESKDDKYVYGWLALNQTESLLDKELAEYPAQYETDDPQHPLKYTWKNVKTKLKDLDTSKTHYVKGPGNLIFIDFDKHGKDGKKDLKLNLKAAGGTKWKPTYVELSNSGCGIHSYYWYDGNPNDLSNYFDEEIEIKVFPEDQLRSMRRRVSRCNNLPIAHISSGLPFKEKKQVINWDGLKDEKHLRNIIIKAIKKECRPYGEEPKTITCVKYIQDTLQAAQDKGMSYDLHDLSETVYAFAANSHNNKQECINIYYTMKFRWPEINEAVGNVIDDKHDEDAPIIILDCEVVKNLTLVIYKELGPEHPCIRLYNPKPHEIEKLLSMRIVGHNVTGYDNNILYALWMGWTPEQIFELSQDIIIRGQRSPFREARNISYTDTLDASSDKKGLKKIEIEMHIPHKEMEIDWSKPLPESEWERLAQYCENDVLATETYFLSKKFQADFKARKILAALTGMTVNDSTNNLTAQLIFGDVKEPWHDFMYPNLKEKFPEYRFENGRSYFGDVLVGEGGLVYADPDKVIHYNVVTFDVASMHPTSIIAENGFGPYTKNYKDLLEARIAIKHKDYDKARKMFDGRLAPYLENDEDADALSFALKIALNSVYGMTAAHFQNRFKDPNNVDNWVAKRGALFMETLRRKVTELGAKVVHIKTDSIKLENPTKEQSDFVINFGKQYGYTFEIESKYERMCLVNHAVYIALRQKDDPSWLKECKKAKEKSEKDESAYIEPTRWTATGAQFAHPFVFKSLFSHEPLEFWDYCETKTVKTDLYLDLNENLPDVTSFEKDKEKLQKRIKQLQKDIEGWVSKGIPIKPLEGVQKEQASNEIEDLKKDISVLDEEIAKGHYYVFVGKAGEFMPIKEGLGGGLLMRKDDNGGYGYATGAKGYRWLESEGMHELNDWRDYIDLRYFRGLVDTAIDTINQFGDFSLFAKGEGSYIPWEERILDYNVDPWMLPCGSEKYAFCADCPDFMDEEQKCKKGFDISKQILRRE